MFLFYQILCLPLWSNLILIFQVCFINKDELQAAVNVYIEQNCGNNATKSGCSILGRSIAQTYGWPIGSWCVSQVTDMSFLFQGKIAFNEDLSLWDASSLVGKTTFNEDLSGWDVSSVSTMESMFWDAPSFNSDISTWDVSSVTKMGYMFSNSGFNSDISQWNVSSVTDMGAMFAGSSFNSDISSWNVSSVSTMDSMFWGATSFNSDISNWDMSSVIDMGYMLYGSTSFNQDLCAWSDKFPYDSACDEFGRCIFTGSGCTFQDTPQESQQGPFCASSCGFVPPSTSPSSSLAPTTALRPSSSPTETCWQVDINVVFDQWASQTSWDVQRTNAVGDNTILKEFIGTDSDDSETRQESICLQEGEYQFTMYDSFGDGISEPGSYNVTSYGEIIKEGGEFVSSESTLFSIPFVAP